MTVNPPIDGWTPNQYVNGFAPTAADSDYNLQSLWYLTDGSIYMINDNTPGAAVWEQIAIAPQAKAWASFDGTDGSIKNSYNVASVTQNSTGNFTVTFTKPLPSNDYALCITTSTAAGVPLIAAGVQAIASQLSTSCTITTSLIGVLGALSATNPSTVSIVCFG